MSQALLGPKDYIFRAMKDFRKENPLLPLMPTSLLAEQLRIPEDSLVQILEQLHAHGIIQLHPMWPTIREAFITDIL